MNIAILSFQTRNFENYGSVKMLAEKIKANGHNPTIIKAISLELRFGTKTEVFYNQKPLPIFDIIIVRPRIIADPSVPSTYMRALKNQGQTLLNGSNSTLFTKNKLEALRILNNAGILTPKTSAINNSSDIDGIMIGFTFPVIIKTVYGSHGIGVFFAESMKSLKPIADFLINRTTFSDPITIQEYIKEADNTDIRVFVVGGKVVASMKRTAIDGEIRANFTKGGAVQNYTLTPEEQDVALKAVDTLGLDYAGVDILQSASGPMVIEVNSNPGFTGIEKATNVDVANEVVKYAIKIASK